MQIARLPDPADRHGGALAAPLLDAKVVRITRTGMRLAGYEVQVVDGTAIKLVQGWWAKYVQGGD